VSQIDKDLMTMSVWQC